MTIFHTVRKLGLSYQQQYMAEISALYPAMWINETRCDRRNALDHFGYSYHHRTTNFQLIVLRCSAIGIMLKEGVQDFYITEGTVNSNVHFCHLNSNHLMVG